MLETGNQARLNPLLQWSCEPSSFGDRFSRSVLVDPDKTRQDVTSDPADFTAETTDHTSEIRNRSSDSDDPVSVGEFSILEVLGRGGFGSDVSPQA